MATFFFWSSFRAFVASSIFTTKTRAQLPEQDILLFSTKCKYLEFLKLQTKNSVLEAPHFIVEMPTGIQIYLCTLHCL